MNKDISKGTKSDWDIAKKHGVTLATVQANRAVINLKAEERKIRNRGVEFGTKTEPYYETEEGMLSLPKYEATNRHLITPINPDWKLF